MGISVKCPNGHEFKVKDKYAGKKGLCPYCKDQVKVLVPDAVSSDKLSRAAYQAAVEEHGGAVASVLDDHHDGPDPTGSGSLLGSSVIQHHVKCVCGEKVPMWFARCPKCSQYMPQR
ncbi:MAG: hypothetical protein MK171_11775 [Pirellulales bacterium]|nr:hypothetical protein [Pirellulales bacterium]